MNFNGDNKARKEQNTAILDSSVLYSLDNQDKKRMERIYNSATDKLSEIEKRYVRLLDKALNNLTKSSDIDSSKVLNNTTLSTISNKLNKSVINLNDELFQGKLIRIPLVNVSVKASGYEINPYQFNIKISDKSQADIIAKELKKSNILYKTDLRGGKIITTLRGASLLTGSLSERELEELSNLENIITYKLKVNSFARIETKNRLDKDYKWVVTLGKDNKPFFFKSLSDMEIAISDGVVKEKYDVFNFPKWSMPVWPFEVRNTLRTLDKRKDPTKYTLLVDGGDEAAIAVNNSGLPKALSAALQATIVFPAFIGLVYLGYKGARDDVKEKKEKVEELKFEIENISSKIRKILAQSILRETAIKAEIVNCSKKTLEQRIIDLMNAYNNEKSIWKALSTIDKVNNIEQFKENIQKIIDNNHAQENRVSSLLSPKTKEILNENEIYKSAYENWDKLTKNKESYAEFINGFSEFKVKMDELYLAKLEANFSSPILKAAMNGMFWSLMDYQAEAVVNIFSAIPSAEHIVQPLAHALGYTGHITLALLGHIGTMLYGITSFHSGCHEMRQLNDWIGMLKDSKILDKETRDVVKSYYQDRKFHQVIRTIGNIPLSLGQACMFLGLPIWSPTPLAVALPALTGAGAGFTFLGIGMRLFNDSIDSEKYSFTEELSKTEKNIFEDNGSIPQDGKRQGETDYCANLRWKADELKRFSDANRDSLVKMTMFTKVLESYAQSKSFPELGKIYGVKSLPKTDEQWEKAIEEIKKNVYNVFTWDGLNHEGGIKAGINEKLYSKKYQVTLKNQALEFLNAPDTNGLIKNAIKMIHETPFEFYKLLVKSSFKPDEIVKEKITSSEHPNYGSFKELMDYSEAVNLKSEIVRKILRRLVIEEKASGIFGKRNIRGSLYEDYILRIDSRKESFIKPPGIIPYGDELSDKLEKCSNELAIENIRSKKAFFLHKMSKTVAFLGEPKCRYILRPYKHKTVYIFNLDKFLDDAKNYNNIKISDPKKSQIIDKIFNEICEFRKNPDLQGLFIQPRSPIGTPLSRDGEYLLRSEVFRPLFQGIIRLCNMETHEKLIAQKMKELQMKNELQREEKNKQSPKRLVNFTIDNVKELSQNNLTRTGSKIVELSIF